MKRHVLSYVVAACLALFACHAGSQTAGVPTDGDSQPRPLSSGPGSTAASRLPDCKHFKEQTGKDDEPVESVNCARWDLLATAPSRTKVSHFVLIADVAASVRSFETGDAKAMTGSCTLNTIKGPTTYAKNFVPVEVLPIRWLKGEPGGKELQLAIDGVCNGDKSFACALKDPTGVWNIGPGTNLLFVNQDCCMSQLEGSPFKLNAIFPIDGGLVYDWDGTGYSVDGLVASILDIAASSAPGDLPLGDTECFPPTSSSDLAPDAITVDDVVSDLGE